MITSRFVIGEFQDKLANKFKHEPEEISEAVNLLHSRMKVVEPPTLKHSVCRDPDDDNILAAAVKGKCDYIITGDKDLIVLKQHEGIDILSPKSFREYEERK